MAIDLDPSSVLAGVSFTAVAGWIGSFFALRKDERATQIEQVTKERTKWREGIRRLLEDIAASYILNKQTAQPEKVAINRAKLAAALNPKDPNDKELLQYYDALFKGEKDNFNAFVTRIALLLKHDWERVKWECTPIYLKPFFRYSARQREWRNPAYRKPEG
jgi:hypothetical protein